MSQGKIVQIIGAVVDVEFPRESVPKVYHALKVDNTEITLEVQQQLGDGVVRCIALGSTDGLKRNLVATNTERAISVPLTLSASYTFGTDSRGNSTSTTAPMICTTLPWLMELLRVTLSKCVGAPLRVAVVLDGSRGHTAAAPPTISLISCVIAAWRALL